MKIHIWKWGFWMWIGPHCFLVDATPEEPLFSERIGIRHIIRIFGIKFEYRRQDG